MEEEVQWTEYTACKAGAQVHHIKYESREDTSTCVCLQKKKKMSSLIDLSPHKYQGSLYGLLLPPPRPLLCLNK